MTGIRILSTGSQQARQVVTNDDMARVVETNDEWIRTRTGIRQRRFAGEEESTTTLAVGAAREAVRALEEGEIAPSRHQSYVRLYEQAKAVPFWQRREKADG